MTRTVAEVYDRIAPTYDAQFEGPAELIENEIAFSLLVWATEGRLGAGRVLDIGCGTGLMLRYLYLEPPDYVGLDISHGMVQQARNRHPGFHFEVGDMHTLDFGGGVFHSVVSSFGSISYTTDPARIFNESYRVLQPGGYVAHMALGRLRKPCTNGTVPHMSFRARDLIQLARRAGFKDVNVRGFSTFMTKRLPSLMKREAKTIGVRWPNLCNYLMVYGRKE